MATNYRTSFAFLASLGLSACTSAPGPVAPVNSAPQPYTEPQPYPPAPQPAGQGSDDYANIPRSGGASVDTAPVQAATGVIEGVIDPGQRLWYRFDPEIPKGRCSINITSRQLITGRYRKRASGRVTLTNSEMTEVASALFDNATTVSDGTFQSSGQPNFMKGPATFMKIDLKDNGAAPVHFRIKLCK